MAEIKGFRALRFTDRAGDIAALCCPPYDIISEDERRAFLKKNPYNIIRLELPKEGADPYRTAGETLRQWLQEGILERDAQEGIYIYEEEFEIAGEIKRFRGVISLVHLEEFSKGIVLPHEETLSKAKADRFHLMDATGCNFSQIYSLYNDDGSVENLLRQYSACEPEISFTDYAGVVQRLWPVYDPAAIAALRSLFADKKLYIADGHHRYETALNYRNHLREQGIVTEDSHPANDVMMMLVDMENTGLVVLPTHRVVRELPHFSSEDLLEKSRACFDSMPCAGRAEAEQMLEAAYTAGKTAFVRGFASVLSPGSRVSSPTYTIVREYRCGPVPLFHFDLYRLEESEDGLAEIGFDEYVSGGHCIVEWSEYLPQCPRDNIKVTIRRTGAGDRQIEMEY